jgi:hypothetical protein
MPSLGAEAQQHEHDSTTSESGLKGVFRCLDPGSIIRPPAALREALRARPRRMSGPG